MELVIDQRGIVRCVYAEAVDLHALGQVAIRRASHVEPDPSGGWQADLGPVAGPVLRGFQHRGQAIKAELDWLSQYWLLPPVT